MDVLQGFILRNKALKHAFHGNAHSQNLRMQQSELRLDVFSVLKTKGDF